MPTAAQLAAICLQRACNTPFLTGTTKRRGTDLDLLVYCFPVVFEVPMAPDRTALQSQSNLTPPPPPPPRIGPQFGGRRGAEQFNLSGFAGRLYQVPSALQNSPKSAPPRRHLADPLANTQARRGRWRTIIHGPWGETVQTHGHRLFSCRTRGPNNKPYTLLYTTYTLYR